MAVGVGKVVVTVRSWSLYVNIENGHQIFCTRSRRRPIQVLKLLLTKTILYTQSPRGVKAMSKSCYCMYLPIR